MTPQILIADRDPLIRCHTSRYLAAHGYDVAVAADSQQCIEQLRFACPDMLVLDAEILCSGANDVIECLQSKQLNRPVKVVLANGCSTRNMSQALQHLAVSCLVRPTCLADVGNFVGELEGILTCDEQALAETDFGGGVCESAWRRGK